MKYLKTFGKNIEIDSKDLVLYQMYKCPTVVDDTICFVGNVIEETRTPLLFILFSDYFYFRSVRWKSSLKFEPINMSIKDYMIQNKIVNDMLEYIQCCKEKSHVRNKKLFKDLYDNLLNDSEVKFYSEMEKSIGQYNL